MIEIKKYLCDVVAALKDKFGTRLQFVGLQGSFARGEAKEDSDVDVMVILDGFAAADIDVLKEIAAAQKGAPLSFSLIAAREEISHWDAAELRRSLLGTKTIFGSLDGIAPECGDEALRTCARRRIQQLYRAAIHNRLEGSESDLLGLYKQTLTIMQMKHFISRHEQVLPTAQLMTRLAPYDARVLVRSLEFRAGAKPAPGDFERLLDWCQTSLIVL